MSQDLLTYAMIVAVPVAIAILAMCLKHPRFGFICLALTAPVSNLLAVGSFKAMYLIGAVTLAGIAVQRLTRRRFDLPAKYVPHIFLVFVLLTYGWLLAGFSSVQLYMADVGALLLLVSVFFIYRNVKDIERWIWIFALAYGIADLFILATSVGNPASAMLRVAKAGVRLQGTGDNPNSFAAAHVLVFAFFLYFIANGQRYQRLISIAGASVTFGTILLAQSRSAIAGVFVAVGLGAIFWIRASRAPMRNMVLAGAFAGALLLAFLNLPEEVGGLRLQRLSSKAGAGIYDMNFESVEEQRFWLFIPALQTIWEYPFGVGYGEGAKDYILRVGGVYKLPHNYVLRELLNYGILGGLYMNVLWILPVVLVCIRAWRRQIPASSLSLFFMVGMAGYLAHSLFHSNTNWIFLWITWGMCLKALQFETDMSHEYASRRKRYDVRLLDGSRRGWGVEPVG
jgi:hypothetical protein